MSIIQSTFIGNKMRKKTIHRQNIKPPAEPDPKMAKMLELLDGGLKLTIINMLKELAKKGRPLT